MLDKLLLRNDAPGTALRTIYDPYNDEELVLSRQELRTLLNIQKGRTPEVSVDPYADHQDWYSNTIDPFPVSAATLPKRRFRPSVWEERKIVKLVRVPTRYFPHASPCTIGFLHDSSYTLVPTRYCASLAVLVAILVNPVAGEFSHME